MRSLEWTTLAEHGSRHISRPVFAEEKLTTAAISQSHLQLQQYIPLIKNIEFDPGPQSRTLAFGLTCHIG